MDRAPEAEDVPEPSRAAQTSGVSETDRAPEGGRVPKKRGVIRRVIMYFANGPGLSRRRR